MFVEPLAAPSEGSKPSSGPMPYLPAPANFLLALGPLRWHKTLSLKQLSEAPVAYATN